MTSPDFLTFMRHSPMSGEIYLKAVCEHIDKEFGVGYSKKNPNSVKVFVEVSAMTIASDIRAEQICNMTRTGVRRLGEEL